MKIFRISLKQKWNNYLEKLARVNKELYGSKRLDCCDLEQHKKQKQ